MHYLKNLYLQLTLFETQRSLPVLVFTIRQRSCGKVMFSVMSVGLFVHMRSHWPLPMMHWTSPYREPPTPGMFKRVQIGPHCTRKPPTPPSVHGPQPWLWTCWNLFIMKQVWLASGLLASTGMLSCFIFSRARRRNAETLSTILLSLTFVWF